MFQDFRFGIRMLLKQRIFATVALITLALGIGANTAIFSVVNAVLLRPLPGYETNRLVIIWKKTPYADQNNVGGDTFKEWRNQAQSFEQMEAGTSIPCTVTGIIHGNRRKLRRRRSSRRAIFRSTARRPRWDGISCPAKTAQGATILLCLIMITGGGVSAAIPK